MSSEWEKQAPGAASWERQQPDYAPYIYQPNRIGVTIWDAGATTWDNISTLWDQFIKPDQWTKDERD